MSSFPSSASSPRMPHRLSQPWIPRQTPSTTPQRQRRRMYLPAGRKSLVLWSVVCGVFHNDLRIHVQPSKRGEPQQTQEPQQPPQPLVQPNNVQATKKEEQVTIHHSTNSSSSKTTTTLPWFNRTLTMVVAMYGQMSNHLLYMAHARQIQRILKAALPGLSIHLIGQPGNHFLHVIPQCFPGLRTIYSSGGKNDPEQFGPIQTAQKKWLRKNAIQLHNVKTPSQIELLRDLLKQQYKAEQQLHRGIPSNNSTHIPVPSSFPDNPYSIPFLYVTEKMTLSGILQHADLYHDLRHWLRIDPSCCA